MARRYKFYRFVRGLLLLLNNNDNGDCVATVCTAVIPVRASAVLSGCPSATRWQKRIVGGPRSTRAYDAAVGAAAAAAAAAAVRRDATGRTRRNRRQSIAGPAQPVRA